mmetsp:Transcript_14458/g.47475  ORF Transcript_14458/g.47475 Transcript_14458/m.47475 type:complete len:209 (+) Transcript_14458:2133-2759(+)
MTRMAAPMSIMAASAGFSMSLIFFSVLSTIRGGMKRVMSVREMPPTRPMSAPNDGMETPAQHAVETKAVRIAREGSVASWVPELSNQPSMMRNADLTMIGKVHMRFAHNRILTKTAAMLPSSIVTTTELTLGPKPTAPMTPKSVPITPQRLKARIETGRYCFGVSIADSICGSVKCTKNRNATDPKNFGKASGTQSGAAAQAIPPARQ